MDTWMGNNSDPVTLHKYLYANVDPANMVDPSGNFGISELGATMGIVNTLTSMQVDNAFNVLDFVGISDPTIETAKTVSYIVGIAAMGAAGIQVLKMLSRKFGKNADLLASQVGNSRAFVFVNRKAAAEALSKKGFLTADELRRYVPDNASNTFVPSKTISAGEKYRFTVSENNIELKWHSADAVAAQKFPNSASGIGWTAQIKMNNRLLGVDGNWYKKPNALTHIPLIP